MHNFFRFITSKPFIVSLAFALIGWFLYQQYIGLANAVKNLAAPVRTK
jgi:hypothetical protein